MKEYLSQKGVQYDVKDITQDPDAIQELVEVHNSRGTPTVVIGEQVLIGFEPEKLDAALASMNDDL